MMLSAVMKYPKTRGSAESNQLTLLSKLTESQTRTAKKPVSHSQIRNWRPTAVKEVRQDMQLLVANSLDKNLGLVIPLVIFLSLGVLL